MKGQALWKLKSVVVEGGGGLCLTAIGPEFEVEICMCDMHTHFLRTFYVMNNLMKF